ncbi:endoglucanase [Amylocarpus encephaloides]|uniref:Endoglucanase n=1 Tax=Amylocarpus encephaloides TaxID=45428 RepID=A0A9P7YIC3_9HELO|nr:endoglucanase [Amylocarpus encephaloides]
MPKCQLKLSLIPTALLLGPTLAHVVLESPKPFVLPGIYGLSNPIEPTGADWPCKIGSSKPNLPEGGATEMPVGSAQIVSFTGLAVHGGGSCQFALLPGHDPSKQNSDFRVIKSVEGGCIAINEKGNLESGKPVDSNITIPNVEPGDYTLAWSFIARIGGTPEFYSMCAPIKVTGGTTPAKQLKEFPPIFMADMGEISGGCLTTEANKAQVAIAYPNPGSNVEHPEGTVNLFKQVCDGNPEAGKGPAASDAYSAPASSTAKPESSSAVKSSPPASSAPASSSANPKPSSAAPTTSKPSLPPTTLSTVSRSAAPTASSSKVPSPPKESAPAGECTDGELFCLQDHFSTCTGGKWQVPLELASHTHCEGSGGDFKIMDEFNGPPSPSA